jgi:hypothetical protein
MNDTIKVGTFEATPHCSKCGSDALLMPDGILSNDDLADGSFITCADCGTVTTYAALVESCEADAAKNFKEGLRSIGSNFLD